MTNDVHPVFKPLVDAIAPKSESPQGECPSGDYERSGRKEPQGSAGESPALLPVLKPAEAIALTVALAQVKRGEPPTPNIASVCVLALARLTGQYDWTEDAT